MSIEREDWLRRYLDDELGGEEERQALIAIAEDPELRALLKFDLELRQELVSGSWSAEQVRTVARAKRENPFSLPEGFADRVMQAIAQKEQQALAPKIADEGEPALRRRQAGIVKVWNRFWQPRPVMWRPAWSAGLAAAALLLLVVTPLLFTALQDSVETTEIPVRQIVEEYPDRVLMRFVFVDRDAESVAVAGDFSDWEPIQLSRQTINGEVAWTGIVPLPRGQHRYMFVKDGERWATDPLAGRYIDDGFGNKNAVINL